MPQILSDAQALAMPAVPQARGAPAQSIGTPTPSSPTPPAGSIVSDKQALAMPAIPRQTVDTTAASAPKVSFWDRLGSNLLAGAIGSVASMGSQPDLPAVSKAGYVNPYAPPADPTPATDLANKIVAAKSTPGALAAAERGVGSMIPFMPLGGIEGGVKGLGPVLGRLARSALGSAATGAASGAGAYGGAALTPGDPSVGATIGAIAGGLTPMGVLGVGRIGYNAMSDVAPFTAGMKARQAAATIREADPNLAQSRASVAANQNREIVPGSHPTVAQVAGSNAIARLEDALKSTQHDAPIQERIQAQRAARAAEAQRVGAEPGRRTVTGEPAAMTALLRSAFNNTDLSTGEAIKNAQGRAAGAAAGVPGLTGTQTAEQAGSVVQGTLGEADNRLKGVVSRLYDSLDARNPSFDLRSLGDTLANLRDENAARGILLEGGEGEKKLMDRAEHLAADPESSWKKSDQLRRDIGAFIKKNRSSEQDPEAARRMTILKRGLDAAIENGIENLPQNEQDALLENVTSASASAPGSTVDGGAGAGLAPTSLRSGSGPREVGGIPLHDAQSGAGAGRLGDSVGDSAVAPGQTGPLATPEDTFSIAGARAAAQHRFSLFRNTPLGPLIERVPNGNFAIAGDKVTSVIGTPGPTGAAIARAVKNASEEAPNALQQYKIALGVDMRRAFVRDGEVQPNLLASWRSSHTQTLDELPDVSQALDNIQSAQSFVDQATQARAAALREFQTRSFQALLSTGDPQVAIQQLFTDTPQSVTKFVNVMSRDPAAAKGMRAAMSRYLMSHILRETGAEGATAELRVPQLRNVLASPKNRSVIRSVLGPGSVERYERIVKDANASDTQSIMQRAQPGSPTTPRAQAIERMQAPKTLLGRILRGALNPTIDTLAAGLTSPVAAIPTAAVTIPVKAVATGARAGALDVLAQAMADPKLFLKLTQPIPEGAAAAARALKAARAAYAASISASPISQNN